MTIRQCLELMKLRIGFVIGATAVTGYGAMAETMNGGQAALLMVSMVLGSGGSAIFNHVWDADIDQRMRRTRNRPMATGAVTPAQALTMAGLMTLAGLVLAVLALNWVVALHLFLGIFVYAVVYTVWLKRRTWMNIIFGGAAGSFALLAGAAVVDPTAWALPSVLAIILFLWTPSHFWALAILLADDYRAAGVPMLPVVVGPKRTAWSILVNSLLLAASSLLPWGLGLLGDFYGWAALGLGVVLVGLNLVLVADPSRKWAGWNFAYSIPYLLLLFAAILGDRYL